MRQRRTRKVVDKFQYKLMARMAVYWLVYQVTLYNLLFCWRLVDEGPGNLGEQYARFFRESYPMLICFAVLVPAFIWDAVKFYHRVAGPLYRVRKTMREVAEEKAVRVLRFRKGDQLQGMDTDMNAMLATLARRGAVTLIGAASETPAAGSEQPAAAPAKATAVNLGDTVPEDVPHAMR